MPEKKSIFGSKPIEFEKLDQPETEPENVFKRIVFAEPDLAKDGLGSLIDDPEELAKYQKSAGAHLGQVKEVIAKIAEAVEGYNPYAVLDALENLMKAGVRVTISPAAERALGDHLNDFHEEVMVLASLGELVQRIIGKTDDGAEDLDHLIAEMDKTVQKRGPRGEN